MYNKYYILRFFFNEFIINIYELIIIIYNFNEKEVDDEKSQKKIIINKLEIFNQKILKKIDKKNYYTIFALYHEILY